MSTKQTSKLEIERRKEGREGEREGGEREEGNF